MAGQSKRGLSTTQSRSRGMKGAKAAANPATPKATKTPPAPRLPGEKAVRETRQAVDVKPLKTRRAARQPMDARAIDRRKQVFDDPKAGR